MAEPGLKLTSNARVCTLDGYSLLLVIRHPPPPHWEIPRGQEGRVQG